MGSERVEPFADNWAYLKAEVNWLERMLMQMVAQQRREHKVVERVAQNKADRVTSHWWKGLISLEGEGKYDDSSLRKPSPPGPKLTHQQQMEARIQASQRKGIVLRLPLLCDRLGLTVFEKNLILLCLAPEINRRYARIYRYLQNSETVKDAKVAIEVSSTCRPSDLPTVDLALSLLCRNDVEWRAARSRLVAPSPLVQWGLLEMVSCGEEMLLSRRLKLADTLTNYLLSDQADALPLETLLARTVGAQTNAKGFLQLKHPTMTWADLVLPTALQEPLQLLRQRSPLDSLLQSQLGASEGTVVLFTGPAGTGKTAVAEAIAQSWQTPLTVVDLALISPDRYFDLIQEIRGKAPAILLIKTAQHWLGRSSVMLPAQVEQLLQQRRQIPGLTIFSAKLPQSIKWHWRQGVDHWLQFPLPNLSNRRQLWQRAFPPEVELDAEIDWDWLARKGAISGGEIQRLAQSASLLAAAESNAPVGMRHLRQVWKQR